MESDNSGAPAPNPEQQPDEFKNFKAELNRKLENQNAQIAQLIAQLNESSKPAPTPAESKKLEDVWFDSPAEAARRIKEETSSEIRAEMAKQAKLQAKQAQVINQLVNDYPELNDQTSDLTTRAVEIFNSLPEDERSHPLAYRTAVRDAAADLDIKPKAKRKASKQDESFSLGGAGEPVKRKGLEDESTKAKLFFYEQMTGQKASDEVKERLNEFSKKNFSQFS